MGAGQSRALVLVVLDPAGITHGPGFLGYGGNYDLMRNRGYSDPMW
jgi:hypothetical protein